MDGAWGYRTVFNHECKFFSLLTDSVHDDDDVSFGFHDTGDSFRFQSERTATTSSTHTQGTVGVSVSGILSSCMIN